MDQKYPPCWHNDTGNMEHKAEKDSGVWKAGNKGGEPCSYPSSLPRNPRRTSGASELSRQNQKSGKSKWLGSAGQLPEEERCPVTTLETFRGLSLGIQLRILNAHAAHACEETTRSQGENHLKVLMGTVPSAHTGQQKDMLPIASVGNLKFREHQLGWKEWSCFNREEN